MPEPLEFWRQTQIEQLEIGQSWYNDLASYSVHRYRDGWHFLWTRIYRKGGHCEDLGRFFDEDHLWEMRAFMVGKWERGILISGPSMTDLI